VALAKTKGLVTPEAVGFWSNMRGAEDCEAWPRRLERSEPQKPESVTSLFLLRFLGHGHLHGNGEGKGVDLETSPECKDAAAKHAFEASRRAPTS
jgi:hypothetical protein